MLKKPVRMFKASERMLLETFKLKVRLLRGSVYGLLELFQLEARPAARIAIFKRNKLIATKIELNSEGSKLFCLRGLIVCKRIQEWPNRTPWQELLSIRANQGSKSKHECP